MASLWPGTEEMPREAVADKPAKVMAHPDWKLALVQMVVAINNGTHGVGDRRCAVCWLWTNELRFCRACSKQMQE